MQNSRLYHIADLHIGCAEMSIVVSSMSSWLGSFCETTFEISILASWPNSVSEFWVRPHCRQDHLRQASRERFDESIIPRCHPRYPLRLAGENREALVLRQRASPQ